MVKYYLLFVSFMLLLMGCKSATLHHVTQTTTTQQIMLGSVGLDKDFVLQTSFNSAAIPTYKEPVKLSVLSLPFNKQLHKRFLKAKASQSTQVNINYIDSLEVKPKYLQLKIADKVTVIEALNNDSNQGIKNYLGHDKTANIITGISIAFNTQDLELIQQADAVFLIEKGLKNYALQLYKEHVKIETLWFSKGVVFAFETAHCCWQENNRHKLDIVDFVSDFNNCPNKTYRNTERAKKDKNPF